MNATRIFINWANRACNFWASTYSKLFSSYIAQKKEKKMIDTLTDLLIVYVWGLLTPFIFLIFPWSRLQSVLKSWIKERLRLAAAAKKNRKACPECGSVARHKQTCSFNKKKVKKE
jgi:hypothetical protein